MPTKAADPATAPCLLAFGGWADAGWFSFGVLPDPAVVAFEFPKLPGMRKQAFRVIERTQPSPKSRAAEPLPQKIPKRLAGKLAVLLDSAGAVRAVASSRTRLLFETGPVLFFAEVPSAKLKQRPANKLRRDLVAIGVSACVLRTGTPLTTLMLWSSAEAGITDFVEAAAPDHPLHPEFGMLPAAQAEPTAKRSPDREAKLLRQIATLQNQVTALTRAQSALGAMEQLGLDDARLKSMLKLLHPDKHANSEAANEAAQWLNQMRDLLKGKG